MGAEGLPVSGDERAVSGPVRVEAHPPERLRRARTVTLPCACCSCCCCCLHTVGGLIGGVVGSVTVLPARTRPVDPDFPFPYRRDELDEEAPVVPAGLLYWMLVSLLMVLTAGWFYVDQGARNPQDLLVGLLVGIFVLPALQLGASLLTVIAVAVVYRDKANAFRRVGHITLWSFVGTLAGLLLMGGCGGVLFLVS
jgi:hypothetical protein